MNSKDENEKEDWEMIGHEPVPGYRTAFYFAIVVSVIYLIFAFSFGGGTGGH